MRCLQDVRSHRARWSLSIGLAVVAGLLVLAALTPTDARAQGSLQAAVTNVPPVLSSPFVADIEQNIRQGQYGVQLTYSSASATPVTARLRLTVRHEGQRILETTSRPATFTPGTYLYRTFDEEPNLSFPETAQDLIDQFTGQLRRQVIRAGVLPEGEYTIEATPVLTDPSAPVSPVPGMARTTVRYPEPPAPINPADQAVVTVDQPVFSWTPVNGTGGDRFAYDLLIAKVLPGQTPLQAVEANRLATGPDPVTLRQRTSFAYTADLPPLEPGATYAWQIRARETTQNVPLSDDGESEIYTFTYQPQPAGYEAARLIAPTDDTPVPNPDAIRFTWTPPSGPPARESDRYRRLAQRLVITPRQSGQEVSEALDENEALATTDLPFETSSRQTAPFPSEADAPQEGSYVWAVQLLGVTDDGSVQTITTSAAAAFSIGEAETPPVAESGTIQMTRFASLVGTDNLEQTGERYSGQAQMALAFTGADAPVRLPAQVNNLRATVDDAGTRVAQEGEVLSDRIQASMPFAQVPGLRLETLRWDDETRRLQADAQLTPEGPFTCADPSFDLSAEALTLLRNGTVAGTATVETACALQVGPFTATPTRTTLHFDQNGSTQTARLESEAELTVSPSVSVTGSLTLNLVNGQFEALDFVVDEPFEWGLPADDPALTFRINRAEVNLDGLLIDGQNTLLLPGSNTVRAAFDSLRVGFNPGGIRSGRVVFDEAFAVEAGMNAEGRNLTYRAVSTNAELSRRPGVLFGLTGTTVLSRRGLRGDGTASAQLSFGDWAPTQTLVADLSDDFALGLAPLGIQQGQVDLAYEGTSIGYVDATGYHPDPSQLVSEIPDRLPLPTEQVAYLQLKRNGAPLVTLSDASGGTVRIETKPGETLDLVVPALQGTPALQAQLQNLRVSTSGPLSYESGTVTASVRGGPIDLTQQDVPMHLQAVSYGPVTVGTTSRTGLFLEGTLSLFGQNTGSDGAITLAVNESGDVSGAVELSNLNERISLAGGGKAALTIQSVSGSVDAPAVGAPSYDLSLGSTFTLQSDGTTRARAEVDLRLTEQSLSVEQFSADSDLDTPPLQVGGFGLDVQGVLALKTLDYSQANGFDFRLGLDLALQLGTPSGRTFTVPLKGVEVFRNAQTGNAGITLPSQQIHAGTKPALDDQQTLTLGPADLRLFNVNLTQDVTIDWFNAPQRAAQALSALQMDLGVRINAYPPLSGEELSIYDAGFNDGVFTGQLDAFSFQPGQEKTITLGGTAGIKVMTISGGLTNDGTPQNPTQGFDIEVEGEFDLPDVFASDPSASCPPMDVSARLTSTGGLDGRVANFAACGSIAFGPATLTFPSSVLELAVDNTGAQEATLSGTAEATLTGLNGASLSATGTAELDLITGELLSSSLAFNGTFDYGVPQQDPLFTFRVQQARLNAAGLTLTGSGSLRTEQDQQVASVAFNQFTVYPDSGIVSGSVTLQGESGLEFGLQAGSSQPVRVIQPSAPTPQNPALRLTLPARLTLDKDGLAVNGSTTASFTFNGETFASLTADFSNFLFGLDPVGAAGGRIDFLTQDGTRVAYYTDRFHPDFAGAAVASVPKKLPLPSTDIAYLTLRDDNDNVLIDYEPAQGGGVELSSTVQNGTPQPITLHLAAIESDGSHPTFDITIPKSNPLTVDEAFQAVRSGRLEVTVDEPLRTQYDLPLRLQTLLFERGQDGTYTLTAGGTVDLPEGLGGEQVTFRDLGFADGGVSGTIEGGAFKGPGAVTASCSDVPKSSVDPLAAAAYSGGSLQADPSTSDINSADLGLRLKGLELAFDPGGNHTFALVGDVTSRLLKDPSAPEALPDSITFSAGYSGGTWRADLCTETLTPNANGDKTVQLQLAQLEPNDNVGAGIGLEIGPNTTNLILSGTVTFPDVLGEDFTATVQNLKMGSDPISVDRAEAATGGQEFTLLNEELKVATDEPPQGFGVGWNSEAQALALSMSGNLWLTSLMCDGNASQCAEADAVRIEEFTVNTNGDVGLGSASANLLANKEPIAVIGDKPDPTLELDELRLETPQDAALALGLGGTIHLPDLMEDAPPSEFGATITSDGTITTDSPLRARFVPEPSGSSDQVDALGDNTPADTEIAFGDIATLDVKEAGVHFNGNQISEPAVYANGAAYIQPQGSQIDDLIRFGTLGSKTSSSAGLYVSATQPPSVNASAQIEDLSLLGFLTFSVDDPNAISVEPDKIVLGGTVGAQIEGVSGSAGWQGLTISRTEGVEDWGQPDGTFSLTLVKVVDLKVDDIDFGSGSFTYEGGDADSTVTADQYFKLIGPELTLSDLGSGRIDEAYYYRADGASSLRLYGAEINVKEVTTIHASLAYEKRKLDPDRYDQDHAIKLFAAGYASFSGQRLTVSGAFENTGGTLRYGLFASLRSSAGITVAPGVNLTGVGGGFFYNPRKSWLGTIRSTALESEELIPGEPKSSGDLTFAAYLYGSALLGGSGQGIQTEALIEITNQHASLYGTGHMKNMKEQVNAGLRLSVHYGDRGGVDGGVLVDVTYPTVVNGRAQLNFAAFENPDSNTPPVHWFVEGELGVDRDFRIMTIYEARGSFIASNSGLLLRKLTVALGTPDLGPLSLEAGATASFWVVPQEDLGAYAEIFARAKLFGGAAKLEANMKGAYIRQDKLIYVAAEGRVDVVAVFHGRVGIWAAIEDGDVRGGTGINERYNDMVADARRQADRMISKAKAAAQQMEELQKPQLAASDEELEEAGVNAVHPESDLPRSKVRSVFSDLKDTESMVLSESELDNLTYALDHLVNADDKPTPDQAESTLQDAQDTRSTANNRIDAVLGHLEDLESKQIEWSNEASETLRQMELGSPVSNVQEAQYSGSGDSRRLTQSPSWNVDENKASQQSQSVADLKESTDQLNEQYQQSIAAVEDNLTEANQLFKEDISFEGEPESSSGQSETTIDELAGLYTDAEALTRQYYAERANYLWNLSGWATAEHATLVSKEGDIVQSFVNAHESRLNSVLSARHNALKQLAPETCCSVSEGDFPEASSANPSQHFRDTYQTWKKNLWYDIFDLGLPVIEEEAETGAKSLGQQLRSDTGSDAHAQFTEQIDEAYAAKHQLLTTYYGMVEAYRGWRKDMDLESTVPMGGGSTSDDDNTFDTGSDYALELPKDRWLGMKLGMVENLLEPPQISSVSVDRSRDGWTATADLTVQARHGNGDAAEISYDVDRGTSTDVYSGGPFYSIGDRTEITLHTFAEERDQQTQDLSVAVRARGPGGATLARRANFTLAVNGDGEDTAPDGTVPDAIEEDSSPPTQLSLSMLGLSYGTETEYERVSISGLGSGRLPTEVERLWTPSSSVLRMEIKAQDRDSDIAGFDYKIGTEQGTGDVRDWTPAQGSSERRDIQAFGQDPANNTLRAVVRGLSLKEDTPYYVSVRARNGAGLTTVYEHDIAIVYDGTPPAPPTSADDPFDEGAEPKPQNVVATYDAVTSPPSRKSTSGTSGDPATPSVTVRWKPGSDESGLRDYYEYVVTQGNPEQPFASVSEGQRFLQAYGTRETIRDDQLSYPEVKSDRLSFTDSTWVHVRAIDYAGNASEPLTIGPVLPTDPSMPTLPDVRAMVVQDGVRLYLKKAAQDPESRIRGYQYEIYRANTGQTLKSYPPGAARDIGVGCLRMRDRTAGSLPTLDLSDAGQPPLQWQGCPQMNLTSTTYAGFGTGQSGAGDESESNEPSTAPYVLIPISDLPLGVPLKIDVTAVNGQGFRDQGTRTGGQGPVVLGPLLLDDSAPTVSASASRASGSSEIDVTIHEAHDPETGIARVEYGSGYQQWTEVDASPNPPTTPQSYGFTFTPSGLATAGGGLSTVTVRVTNGAGQQTTKTVMINTGVSSDQDETNWSAGDFSF